MTTDKLPPYVLQSAETDLAREDHRLASAQLYNKIVTALNEQPVSAGLLGGLSGLRKGVIERYNSRQTIVKAKPTTDGSVRTATVIELNDGQQTTPDTGVSFDEKGMMTLSQTREIADRHGLAISYEGMYSASGTKIVVGFGDIVKAFNQSAKGAPGKNGFQVSDHDGDYLSISIMYDQNHNLSSVTTQAGGINGNLNELPLPELSKKEDRAFFTTGVSSHSNLPEIDCGGLKIIPRFQDVLDPWHDVHRQLVFTVIPVATPEELAGKNYDHNVLPVISLPNTGPRRDFLERGVLDIPTMLTPLEKTIVLERPTEPEKQYAIFRA